MLQWKRGQGSALPQNLSMLHRMVRRLACLKAKAACRPTHPCRRWAGRATLASAPAGPQLPTLQPMRAPAGYCYAQVRFILGVSMVAHCFPSGTARWITIADDDTFVHVPRLQQEHLAGRTPEERSFMVAAILRGKRRPRHRPWRTRPDPRGRVHPSVRWLRHHVATARGDGCVLGRVGQRLFREGGTRWAGPNAVLRRLCVIAHCSGPYAEARFGARAAHFQRPMLTAVQARP